MATLGDHFESRTTPASGAVEGSRPADVKMAFQPMHGDQSTRMRYDRIDHGSPPTRKIALFRSLFRGREDVYPRRFESRKTERTGYQPVCANEWVRGICEKPRIKCSDCSHQRFLSVTDNTIWWHLSGQDDEGKDFVMGIYPMLQDETCFLLAVDFDKEGWREDAKAFWETCRDLKVPAALERSRSGNGAHIWIFFDEAIPASLVRKLGSHILTETMERRPDIGLSSYDRFFPSQDTLPRGGFGNLIALPLQGRARKSGNRLFLNEDFAPHLDQWAFLSAISRIDRSAVEAIVRNAEASDRIVGVRLAPAEEDESEPWTTLPSRRGREYPIGGPLPASLDTIQRTLIQPAKSSELNLATG
jgi:hypothetical protein